MDADAAGAVSFDVDIEDERSIVRVTGTRDAAVVVKGDDGESIYLPPEGFDRAPGEADRPGQSADGQGPTPYDGVDEDAGLADGPYDGIAPAESPYEAAEDGGTMGASDAAGHSGTRESTGVESTSDGFRIVHPASIHDVRILR